LWQSGFQFTVTSGVDSADGREDRAIADRHQGSMATIREAKHASPQKPLKSNKMTKQQLIEQVAAKTELKKSEAEVAVDSVLALIAEALRANERVDLRGFGSFVVKERKAPRPQPSHRGRPSPSPQNGMRASNPAGN